MKYSFIIFILSILTIPSASQDKDDPIDSVLTKCMEEYQSTQGTIECIQTAQESWDKEMNKYYKLLMGILKWEEKDKLKDSQKKWVKYRDAEFSFSGLMHYNMDGTMYLIFNADRCSDIVKQRALELKNYYITLTEGF